MARAQSEAALQRPASKDLVVFSILSDSKCIECGEALWKGNFLFMEKERPLCLACADLDHLVYLPRGDAALTRRAKKHSTLSAVVVQFSRARGHYERQGILVEESALQKAEHECILDAGQRAARREREEVRRVQQDRNLGARVADHISGRGDLEPFRSLGFRTVPLNFGRPGFYPCWEPTTGSRIRCGKEAVVGGRWSVVS